MLSQVKSVALFGIEATPVMVEVDAYQGLPGETIVGLPDMVVKESKNRIRSAIKNSGFCYPLKAYTINLAPAELKKEGPLLDLPIAVAILQATHQLQSDETALFVGELSLNGDIKPIRGMVSICHYAKLQKFERVFIPSENVQEALHISDLNIIPLTHLQDVIAYYNHALDIQLPRLEEIASWSDELDLRDVKGQESVKRALKIAASGGHNILLIGPPGSGKTMLLKRLPSILPPMSTEAAIETSKIYSISHTLSRHQFLDKKRPFRSPHHTISYAGMVGGGKNPNPGEISLAHHGVLFLDELPEFSRNVLEVLRQPLEDKKITISRSSFKVDFPANFILAAAMNPCMCGNYGSTDIKCTCFPEQRRKYYKRISGPILDRIDLIIEVPRLKKEELFVDSYSSIQPTSSLSISKDVLKAHRIQTDRNDFSCQNAELAPKEIDRFCKITPEIKALLGRVIEQGGLTGRSYHKILKISRTIADLEASETIAIPHILEAIRYRKCSLFTD